MTIQTGSAGSLDDFANYKSAFARSYSDSSSEHAMRKRIFDARVAQVRLHNSQLHSWKVGINHLTDRTEDELRSLLGYRRNYMSSAQESLLESSSTMCAGRAQACDGSVPGCCSGLVCGAKGICEDPKTLPEEMDWSRVLATSGDILDQGICGSCWAIAAVAAIQMQAVMNSNQSFTRILSPQGMLGCTPNPQKCGGTGGCDGATPELGFEWAKKYGIQHIGKQRYTASNGCPAAFLDARPAVRIAGYVKLPENKAKNLMNAVVTAGPVGVAVAASSWMAYASGVFDGCESKVVDHAVLLVGYGEDGGKLYWKIRNSWGPTWGENGFIRLRRHAPEGEEPCGWDREPEKGVGCKGGPKKLWVCGECGVLSDSAYPVGTKVDMSMA